MKLAVLVIAILGVSVLGLAQDVEEWVEASVDPEGLQEWLDDLRQNPLELNHATEAEIAALPFFDDSSAAAIVAERLSRRGFTSLDEVLATVNLSREQREAIQDYAFVKSDSRRVPTELWMTSGSNGALDETASHLWGKGRARFRSAQGQSGYVYFSRQPDDPALFAQTSVGLELAPWGNVTRVVAGDFQYEAGTGLVFASSYGISNWLYSPDTRPASRPVGLALRPSSSARQVYRGAAVDVKLDQVEAVILGSWNRMDGAIGDSGALDITEGETSSPALDLARRDQIEERLIGFSVKAGQQWWQAGFAAYDAHYSPTFTSDVSSTSLPSFGGSTLHTGSVFARASKAGVEAIAELAGSKPGGHAFQGTVSASNARVGLAVYHVDTDPDFYSPHSKLWGSFGETANNQRSTGVRLHAIWSHQTLSLVAHMDQTPFRTATSPLSTGSSEVEARWVGSVSAPLDLELLGRRTWNDETSSSLPTQTLRTDRGRVELAWHSQEEYRVRFEVRSANHSGDGSHGVGTLIFFQMKTQALGNDVFARVTFFGLQNDVAGRPMQVYEGGLAGVYPLVSLSGSGRRELIVVSHSWHEAVLSAQLAHAAYQTGGQYHSALDFALGLSYRQ